MIKLTRIYLKKKECFLDAMKHNMHVVMSVHYTNVFELYYYIKNTISIVHEVTCNVPWIIFFV